MQRRENCSCPLLVITLTLEPGFRPYPASYEEVWILNSAIASGFGIGKEPNTTPSTPVLKLNQLLMGTPSCR